MANYREYQKVLKLTTRESHVTVTPPASSPEAQEHIPFLPLSPLSSPTIREREYTMERTRPTPTSEIPEVALTPKWRPSTGISIKSLLN
ncbi:hypothetical protein KL905_002175 [Ogataea polymorpha]|nr:hypothetical protein KL937_001806 [Ogataea polymorpha]KAG7889897.1 hypothetical protein KL936_002571 [Ogataea polymorpha]KAG7893697.1 hypothetical protein KL908_002751 [Ogataea polymorpha]KAG7909574.1 hypothetical protein KL906_002330 [Ogataea polymorpha]KAG7917096.1 hypothetical protein KL927_002870 [Ogataea polymorpha]